MKLKGLDKYVIFSISMLIVYTIIVMVIGVIVGQTFDTLTTCVYGFFGGEIVSCALIKVFKIRGER